MRWRSWAALSYCSLLVLTSTISISSFWLWITFIERFTFIFLLNILCTEKRFAVADAWRITLGYCQTNFPAQYFLLRPPPVATATSIENRLSQQIINNRVHKHAILKPLTSRNNYRVQTYIRVHVRRAMSIKIRYYSSTLFYLHIYMACCHLLKYR